ncbi:MAG TPA: hypothetical protein VMG12_27560 [Polyangiaceae bacterium]|nr:hypothetical protein [Polyangiaceae bacterium]
MGRAFAGLAAALLSTSIGSARAQDATPPAPPSAAASPAPTTPAAPADDAARTKARALGYAGVEAYAAGDYAAASAQLEESYQLLPVPSLGLWSARALVGLRRWVQAEQRYRAVAALPVAAGDSPVQQQAKVDAHSERAELLRRIPSLKIRINGAELDEVSVLVDGAARSSGEIATALLIDPGRHEIAGMRGSERSQVVLTLGEGAHEEVELRFSATPPAPTEAPAPAAAAPALAAAAPAPAANVQPDPDSTRRILHTGAWVAIGAGAAGLATGVISYILGDRQYDSFKDRQLCVNGDCSPDEVDAYNDLRDIHQVSLIAGSIVTAVGVTVLVLTWDAPQASQQVVRLELGPTAVGVSGTF